MEITGTPSNPGFASWVLDPPRETLFRQTSSPFSPPSIGLVLTGSLLSFTLAELLMVPSHPLGFGPTYFSFLLAFTLTAFLFHQLTRLIQANGPSLGHWINAGTVALVPLNLLLPAALMLRDKGNSGFFLYELFKIVIAWAVYRRWVWAIEAMTKWPSWACLLLLMSPFILAAVVGLFIMVMLVSLLLVGLLSGLT